MSRYLELHNFIKAHACVDWLTPSQQRALDAIQNALRFHHTINLYGERGCGKTFLGWICHRESIGAYLPHPRFLQSDVSSSPPSCLIIDNAHTNRAEFRHILKEVQLYRIPNLIAISREPIKEEMVAIELPCTKHDCEKMRHNLSLDEPLPSDDETNLWQLFFKGFLDFRSLQDFGSLGGSL